MSSNTPLVGIVIPTYNGEKYIQEALESVSAQTFEDWVCIVNDNHSSDRTAQIVEAHMTKDGRFILYGNDFSMSQVDNWNTAVGRVPDGIKYLKILCDDDWLYPEYFEKKIAVMEQFPSAGICSSYRLDDKWVRGDGIDIGEGNLIPGARALVDNLLTKTEILGSPSTVLYRVSALKALGSFPAIYDDKIPHFDTALGLDLLATSDLGFVYQVLSYTRRHDDTIMASEGNPMRTYLLMRDIMLRRYSSRDPRIPEFHKQFRARYIRFLISCGLKGNRKCVDWHLERLEERFSMGETIRAIFDFDRAFDIAKKIPKKLT